MPRERRTSRIAPSARQIVLVLAVLAAACAGGARPETAVPQAGGKAAALQPGDMVRLKIWREPDLSGEYDVNSEGFAMFPKVGNVHVAELAPDSVKSLLIADYSRYLQDPAIEVTLLRRVNVLGEVKNPGLYHVDPTMTLTDVVAMAGGVTSQGNSKKIKLLRRGETVESQVSLQSRLADIPLRSGDELRIPERSWLSRNVGVVTAGITGAAIVLAAVLHP